MRKFLLIVPFAVLLAGCEDLGSGPINLLAVSSKR